MAGSASGNAIEESLADHWSREGYIVVRGIYEQNRVARLKALCEDILEQWRVSNPEKGEPGGSPDAHVMRHLNHPGYFSDQPDGRPEILEAAAAPSVLETVAEIFSEQPRFFAAIRPWVRLASLRGFRMFVYRRKYCTSRTGHRSSNGISGRKTCRRKRTCR